LSVFQVPVTFLSDIAVVMNYYQNAQWAVIFRLLPPTVVGLGLGMQLLGAISKDGAKALIGGILMGILLLNLSQEVFKSKSEVSKKKKDDDHKSDDEVPAYATTYWFAWLIGLTGGVATVLTNSMGPMLNVFLLTLKLKPADFVGTRATFFCVVNSAKMGLRIYNGSLSTDMLTLGFKLGGLAVSAVLLSALTLGVFVYLFMPPPPSR
jgi:uncharacterized membrane protein YfcA